MSSDKKIVIVGGVAGGASFAARMRRLNERARIVMFDKGEFISFANCGLPYHISEVIPERNDLILQTPEQFNARYNVDVRTCSEVTAVDTEKKVVHVRTADSTYKESFDILLLSPGCTPIRPPIPGINLRNVFTLRTIPDMDRIKQYVTRRNKPSVAVVGGGFIGLEVAENLCHIGCDVSLVELADQIFTPADREMAVLLQRQLTENGINLHLGTGVSCFKEEHDESLVISLSNDEELIADCAILAIGVSPDTSFLKDSGIERNKKGAIVVNAHMQTGIPGIYAVGDAVEVTDFVSGIKTSLPLAGPANRQARIAADNVEGISSTYKHTQGTAICKLFNRTAAVTGLNEKNARRFDIAYKKSYTHSNNHASYYPGAFPMSIKLLFAPDNGRILGAQIVGSDGVDKRIDVFATAIRRGLTVSDLTELELSYAPPYGSAKDPVNIAGFVAENILTGRMPVFYSEDIAVRDTTTTTLLDVRTQFEHKNGSIPDSVCIPVDQLRKHLDELDRSGEILIFCQVGLRGYIATSILKQHGFNVRNLSGGYTTWSSITHG